MCLILISYQMHEQRPLVIAANRDEYFSRPTQPAAYWSDHSQIYAGRDLEGGGTWLGVTRQGRFAVVSNWTEATSTSQASRSRGDLVRHFLTGSQSSAQFIADVRWNEYQGVNLLAYDGTDLLYTNNRTHDIENLAPGFYGMTNAHLWSADMRSLYGLRLFEQYAERGSCDDLIQMLHYSSIQEHDLSPEIEHSPCFIYGEFYGTRASTAVIYEADQIQFDEQSYHAFGTPTGLVRQHITIDSLDQHHPKSMSEGIS